ncbi:MAG: protein kinase [Terriglobia bacterium]|jgi:serine/threonine-protein kinase
MKTCPTCQKTYPDDFSLCPRDGTPLTAQATETEAQLAAGLSRRFRLVRRLGKGGMGTVFLAEQIGVGNRPVALKVLNRKLLDDPDFLLRFQNEAGSTGRIRHPNVVTIHESAQSDDGTPYIAMEFLEGESLREVLKQRGALPLPEVAEILQQAARGLNAAHKLGIIHRDLKPDNIFLTHGDEGELVVKVVDFGIAKLRESSTMHTQTGMVLGTPAYMSCEQASGMKSDELDARSDIYSLAVVVYEMLSGRVPFHSDTPLGYLRKHMLETPPPFRAVAQGLGVPPQVEAVVMKALKKEREERYQSAVQFAHAFVASVLPAHAPDVSQPLPPTRITVSPPVGGFDAPVQQPSITPAQADVAVQTPLPAPPEKVVETPSPQPQGSKPRVAENHQPDVHGAPQFQAATKSPGQVKYILLSSILLAVIAAGTWHFSHSGPEPSQQVRSPSPGAAFPTGKEAKAEAPPAEPRTEPTPASPLGATPVANGPNGLTSESEASIRNAVGAWVRAFRSKDTTALADSYAPLVEKYFLRNNISREQIRQNLESTFAGMVDIRTYEVNDIRVAMVPGGNSLNGINYTRATATFRKTWDTLESDGKSFSGEEIEQLTFTSSPQGWKVIREEELKILRVSRR